MTYPKSLIVSATDEVFTSIIPFHFLWCAFEVWYDVEKVEREKNHSGDNPLECKRTK